MQVYLDTCFISRIPDLRIKPEDADAYAKIAKIPGLRLVTSSTTAQEIAKTADAKRRSILQFLESLFAKVPSHPVSFSGLIGAAPVGAVMVGGGSASPIYNGLSRIFDRDDAINIFQAFRSGCEYFLTLDHTTVLSRTA